MLSYHTNHYSPLTNTPPVQQSRLLALAPELRNQIYELMVSAYLQDPGGERDRCRRYRAFQNSRAYRAFQNSITLTRICRQVRAEAKTILIALLLAERIRWQAAAGQFSKEYTAVSATSPSA